MFNCIYMYIHNIHSYFNLLFVPSPIDRNVKDVELIAARLRRLDTFSRLPPSLLRDIANVAYYEDLEKGVTSE